MDTHRFYTKEEHQYNWGGGTRDTIGKRTPSSTKAFSSPVPTPSFSLLKSCRTDDIGCLIDSKTEVHEAVGHVSARPTIIFDGLLDFSTNRDCVKTLSYAKSVLLNFVVNGRFDIDLEELEHQYRDWVEIPSYLAFENSVGLVKVFRASKRGNKAYAKRLNARLRAVFDGIPESPLIVDRPGFRSGEHGLTNCFFLTLTFDTNLTHENKHHAWKHSSYYLNKFFNAFRKRYGKIWTMRTIESTVKGFPHFHALVFSEKPFECFKHGDVWRLAAKPEIAELWHSNIDIKVPYKIEHIKSYLVKDLFKSQTRTNLAPGDLTTLSLTWIYEKRSFSISRNMLSNSGDLIKRLSIIQTPTDEEDIEEEQKEGWVYLGTVVIRSERGDPPDCFVLNDNQKRDLRVCVYGEG